MFRKMSFIAGLLAFGFSIATPVDASFGNPDLEFVGADLIPKAGAVDMSMSYSVRDGYQYINVVRVMDGLSDAVVVEFRTPINQNPATFTYPIGYMPPVSVLPSACISAQKAGVPLEDELSCRRVSGSWNSSEQECSCR